MKIIQKPPKTVLEQLNKAEKILFTVETMQPSTEFGHLIPYFNVYTCENCKFKRVVDERNPFWDSEYNAYKVEVYGTDRIFKLLTMFARGDNELANKWYKKTMVL